MNVWVNKKNICFFLLAIMIAFTSCDSLKKVPGPDKTGDKDQDELDEIQGRRVFNPETGKYEVVTDVTGVMDTVQWNDARTDVVPPITSEATIKAEGNAIDENTELLSSYKVAFVLPFLAETSNALEAKIDRRSLPALNFYEGAKMALDVLSGESIDLEVSVLDTWAKESKTRSLTEEYDVVDANLVIGTFRNNTAGVMANFANKNKTTFVSPFYPHQNLTSDNPYFIQLNPSEKTHCDAIMKHAKARFDTKRIVVFGRNSRREQRLMKYYEEAHQAIEGSSAAEPIELVTISDESSSLEETDLLPYMDDIESTAFIIASSNESFVYSMLRKIDLEKEDRSVVVYGQPRWIQFTQIGYQYYETMNVHITSESYLNPDSDKVQEFKENFYNKYGMPPTKEAFKGYDTMLYFGRMLHEFGTGFRNKLDQNPANMLHTRFDIQRVVTTPREGAEGGQLDYFDQYMNKYLNILEFSEYQFRKAD
jgi:ABC-type branched-subunit amino acid transport system substrate-binding protein